MIVRLTQGLLLLTLLACDPIARALPAQWGWENGVFENLQVAILLGGFAFALLVCRRDWKSPAALLALCVLPFWAIMIARELSWGAVFLPPLDVTSAGPSFSSQMLWYKPIIYPIVAVLVACSLYVAARHRTDRVLLRAVVDGSFPLFEPILMIAALYVSTCAEGHALCPFDMPPGREEVLEELVEVVAYMALWLAQLRLLNSRHLRFHHSP